MNEPLFYEDLEVDSIRTRRRVFTAIITLLVFLSICFISAVLTLFLLGYRISRVNNTNMEPHYRRGQIVVVKSGLGIRGQTVRYRATGETFFARVIAIPGDEVMFTRGEVLINGELEPQLQSSAEAPETVVDPDASLNSILTVGEGEYLLLADNRDISVDSRDHGLIHEENILGVVVHKF